MFHPDQLTAPTAVATIAPTRTGACLVAGCPCKDARIVSHRRAAFFAAVARADRRDRRSHHRPSIPPGELPVAASFDAFTA